VNFNLLSFVNRFGERGKEKAPPIEANQKGHSFFAGSCETFSCFFEGKKSEERFKIRFEEVVLKIELKGVELVAKSKWNFWVTSKQENQINPVGKFVDSK
jgi:hypothetical protein